jgi:DNA-binding MarR family transcriptional regulator
MMASDRSPSASHGVGDSTDAGPRTSVLLDVWLLGHLTSGLLDSALADSGLTADDFGLYSMLRGWGPMTPGELAATTGMRQNTVSAALQRLDKRGHLNRTPNPSDARSTLVSLNEAGIETHLVAASAFLAIAEQLDEELGTQKAAIRSAVGVLDEALRQQVDAAPRPYLPPKFDDDPQHLLTLRAPQLTNAQRHEVERYAQWLAHRDGTSAAR